MQSTVMTSAGEATLCELIKSGHTKYTLLNVCSLVNTHKLSNNLYYITLQHYRALWSLWKKDVTAELKCWPAINGPAVASKVNSRSSECVVGCMPESSLSKNPPSCSLRNCQHTLKCVSLNSSCSSRGFFSRYVFCVFLYI